MNFEFLCLAAVFTLLVLLITFGESFSSYGWSSFISTNSNNVSAKSIIQTIKI
jgi:hypothetical protein